MNTQIPLTHDLIFEERPISCDTVQAISHRIGDTTYKTPLLKSFLFAGIRKDYEFQSMSGGPLRGVLLTSSCKETLEFLALILQKASHLGLHLGTHVRVFSSPFLVDHIIRTGQDYFLQFHCRDNKLHFNQKGPYSDLEDKRENVMGYLQKIK